MNVFVESLKRLFENQRITMEKVEDLFKNKKINQEEFNYIIGKE